MTRPVLVVSHADADGHVIAEQVRRNLAIVPTFAVSTIVDPKRTSGHRMWTALDSLPEIDAAEIIFFVDLMFAPASYGAEAEALVSFALARPMASFFILDHHPLPFRLLEQAPNLHPIYQRDVVDCTFGNPSWLMCIAALLEKQPTRADQYTTNVHTQLAEGIRRAAAPGGPLTGERLLALLRYECWPELIALGLDDKANHHLPRGRRPRVWEASEPLLALETLASELLRSEGRALDPHRISTRRSMSYDLEVAPECIPEKAQVHKQQRVRGTDLEAITTLVELAAISLSHKPDDTFSEEELYDAACRIGGKGISLDKVDVKLVLDKAAFLKKEKRHYRLK
jgi:hypothetical protein